MAQPSGLRIRGARQNNLKNISLEIPHGRLTVVTGVSGSGKSSLAFDTLFAEGQWRYIESLSTYARMFLDRVDRPDVDKIEQIRPAVALEQKNPVRTARSTVGTATEIYDYLRLLYAKIGRIPCPPGGAPGPWPWPRSIAEALLEEHPGARAMITFGLAVPAGLPPAELWANLTRRGFARVRIDGDVLDLAGPPPADFGERKTIAVILDRVVLDPAQRGRITESVEAALREGGGRLAVEIVGGGTREYGEDFRCSGCGAVLERPQPLLFSFNHPLGACPECKGFGNVLKYDEARVVPDRTLSLADGAVEPWTHPSGRRYQRELMKASRRRKVDTETPWEKLSEATRGFVYAGDGSFPGIQGFFEEVESYRYKLHVRVFLSRYRSQSVCQTCHGARLKPAALAVRVAGLTIAEFTALTIDGAARLLGHLGLSAWEAVVAREILRQLNAKLTFLLRVGLGYLTLSRQTRPHCGGEAQRTNLANQLGSQLVGTLCVLDEPSIGLHARDTARLTDLCRELAQAGNTVVVVEHDREFIAAADHIVELGPGSGERGGEIVFNGSQAEFQKATHSLTARYVSGRESILVPPFRRSGRRMLTLAGARQHTLKDVTIRVPLHTLTAVSGVSGRRIPEARDVLLRGCVRRLSGVRGPTLPARRARREAPQPQHQRRAPHDRRRGRRLLRRAEQPRPPSADSAIGRARLSPPRSGGDDSVGRRGTAPQDRRRARGPCNRRNVLHPRRTDDWTAPRRCEEAPRRAQPAGRRRQHRAGRRAPPRRDQVGRLRHRPRARGRRGGRRDRRRRSARDDRPDARLLHGQVPGRDPSQAQRQERPFLREPSGPRKCNAIPRPHRRPTPT